MCNQRRSVTGSFAPKGQNEIAQGRAKRHPGWYAIALGKPKPQFAKALKGRNMLALIDAPPVPPFQGLGCFVRTESQGGASLCPGLSPCAPLGHKTIGLRSMNHHVATLGMVGYAILPFGQDQKPLGDSPRVFGCLSCSGPNAASWRA